MTPRAAAQNPNPGVLPEAVNPAPPIFFSVVTDGRSLSDFGGPGSGGPTVRAAQAPLSSGAVLSEPYRSRSFPAVCFLDRSGLTTDRYVSCGVQSEMIGNRCDSSDKTEIGAGTGTNRAKGKGRRTAWPCAREQRTRTHRKRDDARSNGRLLPYRALGTDPFYADAQ